MQVFDLQKEKYIASYQNKILDDENISSNTINDIIRYNKDTLLLATEMGINIFDTRNQKFNSITANEGLPGNIVLSIIRDDKGYIWAALAGGRFCKVNIHDSTVISYDESDGITEKSFCSHFLKLKNNHIIIGGAESLVEFNPGSDNNFASEHKVEITSLFINRKEISMDSIVQNGFTINLPYNQNSIRIEFASFEFWDPQGLKYSYRLEGSDADWRDADKSNSATYDHLNDGKYIFKVQCRNKEGKLIPAVNELTFIISPPFW